jgi:hypothetical protein
VPDFSWITEIDDAVWMPALLGKVSVNVGFAQLRQMSNVPNDMADDEMLRAFDAWSFQQAYEYNLMHQPGASWLLTREERH